MATVTITLKDTKSKGVILRATFKPKPEEGGPLTNAQYSAAFMLREHDKMMGEAAQEENTQ